ncbi:hypothetical protein B0J11DRAFT_581413 [Dendryphion nanum]|uniref:Extracellular membrane protein CFEM domain-containing protein n=1 Tax=Dendryphion nanum TaxID=256645 RepID=A0A9P9DPK9_9PLEO|nr:hypothetical protein B0J11DRAFT_581413 [Dendryphion nanum]
MPSLSILVALLVASQKVLALDISNDVRNIRDVFGGNIHQVAARQNNDQTSTITSSAHLACATGDSASKYSSCSSSISEKIDKCNDDDIGCACRLANDGFGCLTSHCRSHTEAVCAGSVLLSRFCGAFKQPVPSFTDYTCPSSINAIVNSIIQTDIDRGIPSDVASLIPSGVLPSGAIPSNVFASDIPYFNEPQHPGPHHGSKTVGVADVSTSFIIAGPGPTGGAGRSGGALGLGLGLGREREGLNGFLGVGIVVAVAVGGLAAFL